MASTEHRERILRNHIAKDPAAVVYSERELSGRRTILRRQDVYQDPGLVSEYEESVILAADDLSGLSVRQGHTLTLDGATRRILRVEAHPSQVGIVLHLGAKYSPNV